VVENAQNLASTLNTLSTQLNQLRTDLNSQASIQADKVNTIATQIAQLTRRSPAWRLRETTPTTSRITRSAHRSALQHRQGARDHRLRGAANVSIGGHHLVLEGPGGLDQHRPPTR